MSKTIEEAVQLIAKDFIAEHKSCINNDAPLTHECVQYAVERIFAMPLSSRLTAEEKERIDKAYAYAITHIEFDENRAEVRLLHRIFGADFFKKGE